MPFDVRMLKRSTYLHFVVTGQNTPEIIRGYLMEILRISVDMNYDRALIEENLEGPRLGAGSVFDLASKIDPKIRDHFQAIAYVDAKMQDNMMRFAEKVATSRSVKMKFFHTVKEAEDWLEKGEDFGF